MYTQCMATLDDWGTLTELVAAMELRVSLWLTWHLMHRQSGLAYRLTLQWTSLLISKLCFCCRAQMCRSGSVGVALLSSPQCCSRRRRSWECYVMARGSLSGRWISLRTSWMKRWDSLQDWKPVRALGTSLMNWPALCLPLCVGGPSSGACSRESHRGPDDGEPDPRGLPAQWHHAAQTAAGSIVHRGAPQSF